MYSDPASSFLKAYAKYNPESEFPDGLMMTPPAYSGTLLNLLQSPQFFLSFYCSLDKLKSFYIKLQLAFTFKNNKESARYRRLKEKMETVVDFTHMYQIVFHAYFAQMEKSLF